MIIFSINRPILLATIVARELSPGQPVHLLLNTQRIFLSLVPGIVPNILFCATYSRLLTHDSLRTRPDQCLAQSHLAAFQECTP